jgi:glycine cleavage system aminomethyltransferase T
MASARTGEFIGCNALPAQREDAINRRQSCLAVKDLPAIPHVGEPIFCEGDIISYVISGGYGPTVGMSITPAYLPTEPAEPGNLASP